MLGSRISIVKPRKRSILGQQLQTGESVVYVPQVLAIENMNYTVLVQKLSQGNFARAIGCSSIVSGCHVRHKELMFRDWATLRRRGTFL